MVEKKYYSFTSPIGRLVSGTPGSFRTTDTLGAPLIYKTGPKKGEPKKDFSIGVAYRKDQADVPAFIRELTGYAAKEWPNIFDADLKCSYDSFASKITDGDSTKMNKKQRRPCDNPDWRGCWIVWYSSDREPECVSKRAKSRLNANEIKTGYYVRVKASTSRNTGDTPGMYMNLEGVELFGYGPEISNRPDPTEAFREKEAEAIPEGLSDVPLEAGDVPVKPREATPAPPPAPPASDKVSYQGVVYAKEELRKRGWSEAQISSLPMA